jgi:hypothetical protein
MSDPSTPPNVQRSSLRPGECQPEVRRDTFCIEGFSTEAISDFVGDPTVVTDSATEKPNSEKKTDESSEIQDLLDIIDKSDDDSINIMLKRSNNLPVEESSKKRSRFSFSKRKILAGPSFFSVDGRLVTGINGLLVGVITRCPRKDNGYRFYIDWLQSSPGLPSFVDTTKLQNWYPRNDNTNELLKQFCADYDDAFGKGQVGIILGLSFAQQTTVSNTTVARGTSTPENQKKTTDNCNTAVLPTPDRYSRRATITTHAADSSTISTVTASTLNRISRRSDPFTGESDSASDSDIDEEEDQAVIQFQAEDDDDDDDDDEAISGETETDLRGNIDDLSDMIKKIVWDFKPVKEGDVLRPVEQMYSGPSGIRRSVAGSFQTPTEAFEICGGLSKDFVRYNRLVGWVRSATAGEIHAIWMVASIVFFLAVHGR